MSYFSLHDLTNALTRSDDNHALSSVSRNLLQRTIKRRTMPSGRSLRHFVIEGVPYPIYRSTCSKYLRQFLQDGTIMIGTLWNFRKSEAALGPRIGDRDEGVRGHYIYDGISRKFAFNANQDQFVICTSTAPVLKVFNEDNYDALYQIDTSGFFLELAKAIDMIHPLSDLIITPVAYCSKEEEQRFAQAKYDRALYECKSLNPYINMFPAAAMKDKRFDPQKEVRGIFVMAEDKLAGSYPNVELGELAVEQYRKMVSPIKPLLIKVPAARKYVTPLIGF